MKLHNWRLRWCTFLFIATSDFWRRNHFIELLLTEYLPNVFISWTFAVIILSKFPSCFYQRKRKMNVTFTLELFAFTNSDWHLLMEKSYLIVDNQSACCYSYFQNFQLLHPLWRAGIGLFRTQSNMKIIKYFRKKAPPYMFS